MRCFNCGIDIGEIKTGICPNCSSKFNATKANFISYIGSPDSLAGYQKSYKLLLLKAIIQTILENKEPTVSIVISRIKDFYLHRKMNGLQPDYDVDTRIAEIESSSDYDVFAVIKSQPFKVINEKGYLFLNRNAEGKLVFVFNEDIANSMSKTEWEKLINIVDDKIQLYYQRYDGANRSGGETIDAPSTDEPEPQVTPNADLSVLEITNLSVRAKNVLMRNKLYTLGAVLDFVKDNDLLELKNMGQKTCDEILSLLASSDIQTSAQTDPDSISILFAGNTYHLFVEYCNRNGLETLSDLEDFDFTLLLNESGFGVGKLEAIKLKYQSILQEAGTPHIETVADTPTEVRPSINIDTSNLNLEISCLRYAGISAKSNAVFFENGYSKIGDLSTITLGKLIRMFGRNKAQTTFEKIKLFETPLLKIATDLLNQQKDNREFEIYIDRANKKTLQEIADKHGLTRERVRQIEAKFFRQFAPLFGSLIEQHMTNNNLSYILTQDVLEFFDDDAFDTVIMYTLQESPSLEYLSFADMFIKKKTEAQDTKAKLYKLTSEFIGDGGINFFECLPQIEEMLNDSELDFISTDAFLNYLFEINAHFYGDFVFLKKQPYVNLCLMLINKYFKDGIALHSDEEINLLRSYFHTEFGEYELPEQNRAISAQLSAYLITCDRGKAKLIENINFDQSVIDDIKNYIDSSPLKTLYFAEIFNEFEGILAFTSDITNYHGLHGILAYLYRDEYEFSRDCLTKKDSTATSLSLSERIVLFINEKGSAVSRAEIKKLIGGLSDLMLVNAVNNSDSLLQWDYNSFNTIENINITNDDKSKLQEILEEIFQLFKGYCSDRLIFEKAKKELPEFVSKNQIENTTNLFYVLQNLFGGNYQFSRPHICQKGIVDSLTTKAIALYLLGTTQQISRSAFMEISRSVCWSETTADLIFYELEKDYVRVSEDIYILSDEFCVDEQALKTVESYLSLQIASNDYLSMIGFTDFEAFPSVPYEWNSFLLVSIIKKYNLGVKLVSPAIRDRRYNKEIVVSKDSDHRNLDDIVYALLTKNNITYIDESNLLSFLVINHLVAKVIPKELYDSKKLNYADGYFRLS